jgi:GPH family glycoside/pentoside/hexuronide:cation symporter
MPLWVRAVARFGLAAAWLAGMGLAVAAFCGRRCWARATWLAFHRRLRGQRRGAGRRPGLPGALLAGVIQRAGHGRRAKALLRLVEPPPSSTWRWPPAWPCRCWPAGLHARRHATPTPGAALAYCRLPCLLKLMAPRPAVATVDAPKPR